MGLINIREQRAPGKKEIIYGKYSDVKDIAPKQISYCHIHGSYLKRGNGDNNLRE